MRQTDIQDIYPLSPLQHGVLFHDALDPQGGDFIVQLAAELAATTTPEVFRAAWQMMIDRHPVLRTAFLRDAPRRPLQAVLHRAQLPWTERDWRDHPATQQQTLMQTLLSTDRHRGFTLTDPPLMRITAIRLTATRWRVLLTFHHILWDGWSLQQLLGEVSRCCAAITDHRAPDLPDRRPFRDYIQWLDAHDQQSSIAFWHTELAGLTGTSPLGVDRPAPDRDGAGFGRHTGRLTPATHAALTAFGQQHKLTSNTLVQGALAILLARYTSTVDITFGATVAGRPTDLADADTMLGLFLNTIPVRVQVTEDTDLLTWLTSLQQRQLLAREHDQCQLADIQRAALGAGGVRLFDCILDYKAFPATQHPAPGEPPVFAGAVDTVEQSGYPLTITVSAQPELLFELDYSHARFEQATIARMTTHLQTLLANLPRASGRPIAVVDHLDVGERRAIESWSTRPTRTVRTTGFHHDFEHHARISPTTTAIITDQERCSYDTLNRRANQLARHLRRRGMGPENRVGVCLDRSVDLIVTLVAILKTGAAYVPLDPDYPAARLRRYAADARVDAMIINADTQAAVPDNAAPRINLNRDHHSIEQEAPTDLGPAGTTGYNLAYIIFTSGSTGTPKGAMVDIKGMLNHADAMIDALSIGPGDVVAQTASICFDISVWQMLTPLLAGAAIRIFAGDTAFDPTTLIYGIHRDAVTILQVVPALLRLLLDETARPRPAFRERTLRALIVTGEAVPPELATRWLHTHPGIPLLNAYGPAECADDVTLGELNLPDLMHSRTASIGKPIANTEVYILDPRMRLTAIGVTGEIYLGGDGVGRGYAGNPARTAATFVPHPFAERPGERLYRTGDLARWTGRGALDYIGRCDTQIKLNGARIETTEIEHVLLQHDHVEQAVVTTIGSENRRRLAAFVVLTNHDAPPETVSELHRHLHSRLPRHMTPNTLILVDALPLNPSGKLDLERLIAVNQAAPDRTIDRDPTPAEEEMAAIWSALLETAPITPDSDFFDLGGHSLVAMQLISRVGKTLGCRVPLRTLFDAPRLADFTIAVRSAGRSNPAERPILHPVSRAAPLPASSVQQRMWNVLVSSPEKALFAMPAAFRLTGSLDPTALATALADVVTRHETLRTAIRTDHGRLVQVISPPPTAFPLPIIDLTRYGPDTEATARTVTREEAFRGVDPISDPPFRAALLTLAPQKHLLLLTLSHLVADDASWAILLSDLDRCYLARCAGLEPPLPTLPVQYGDYVAWQRKWQDSAEARAQQQYWRTQLHPPWTSLHLPTSQPRVGPVSPRFRRVRRTVAAAPTRDIERMARTHGVTLFTAVHAAYVTFLHRRTGQHDIWVATMMSTRSAPDLQDVIGPLLTTILLRTDLTGARRFCDLLPAMQKATVDAITNRELPLERVIAAASTGHDQPGPVPARTLLLFQQMVDDDFMIGDIHASRSSTPTADGEEMEMTSYELICEIEVRQERLDIIFRYNADLFDNSLADEMIDDFSGVLASSAANPDQAIAADPERGQHDR